MLLRRRQSPKWFNSEIRHYQKCLRSMRRRLKAHPTLQRLNKVKHMENLLQSKLIQTKASFETRVIESHQSCNSYAIYSYIRSISGQNTLPSVMNLDNTSAVTDIEKAIACSTNISTLFSRKVLFSCHLSVN